MAGFVQIIEMQTSRIDEVDAVIEARRAGGPILEFDSYEQAMESSDKPETSEMAKELAALCDGPARFYNLDIRRSDER